MGGVLGSGGSDATSGAACRQLPQCPQAGGRGNVCGGTTADVWSLNGSGFDAYEGATVVTRGVEVPGQREGGLATIADGRFEAYVGYFADCSRRSRTYRIEANANGRCDEEDRVYIADLPQWFAAISGDAPGTESTCAEFGDGFDLAIELSSECLPSCGNLGVGLFDANDTLIARDWLFLDGPPLSGHLFVGLLGEGQEYRLKWYYTADTRASECQPGAVWSMSFTATAGLNRATLSLLGAGDASCF